MSDGLVVIPEIYPVPILWTTSSSEAVSKNMFIVLIVLIVLRSVELCVEWRYSLSSLSDDVERDDVLFL